MPCGVRRPIRPARRASPQALTPLNGLRPPLHQAERGLTPGRAARKSGQVGPENDQRRLPQGTVGVRENLDS